MLAHKTKNHESNDLECIIQNKLSLFSSLISGERWFKPKLSSIEEMNNATNNVTKLIFSYFSIKWLIFCACRVTDICFHVIGLMMMMSAKLFTYDRYKPWLKINWGTYRTTIFFFFLFWRNGQRINIIIKISVS